MQINSNPSLSAYTTKRQSRESCLPFVVFQCFMFAIDWCLITYVSYKGIEA